MTKLLAVLFITLMPFSACKAQALAIDALLTPDIGGIKQFVEIKTDDSKNLFCSFYRAGREVR
ncbi:hypothetical protein [Janthinobacterium lividum]|uniref:hypothetical protein n=1 Tax=Janthinobacterium lividum TaxID=29581 RepID=UPI0020931DC1|nr:hypothetical protein [Janthinobacterium lividum]